MLEILAHGFAAVCGQDPGHTWAPGGILLPCCQRCTGLYVGASVAALLHLVLRPKLSGRFLEIHGAFLLAMIPFGFHWVAQGPVLRTLSGVLFGFGVVTFLWLPLIQTVKVLSPWLRDHPAQAARESSGADSSERSRRRPSAHSASVSEISADCRQRLRLSGCLNRLCGPHALFWFADCLYFLFLGATLLLLPTTAMLGGVLAAYALASLALWGALTLVALVVGDLCFGLLGTLRRLHWLTHSSPQP